MAGCVEVGEILHHMGCNDILTFEGITNLINQLINSVPPSSIEGRCMEERGICITLCEPGDSRFGLPKILLTLQEGVIFMQKLIFNVVEEDACMVSIRFF